MSQSKSKKNCSFCRMPGATTKLAGTCSRWCFEQEYGWLRQIARTTARKVVDMRGKPVSFKGRGWLSDGD